ncbi:unnamed protein product [Chrysoparadoxa australica]
MSPSPIYADVLVDQIIHQLTGEVGGEAGEVKQARGKSNTISVDAIIAELEGLLGEAVPKDVKKGSKPQTQGKAKGKPNEPNGSRGKPKASSDDPGQPSITKLDIRIGVITKVWKHETAEKLWCEEIDVGEPEPRQIASGLVAHYSQEEMLGRRVLVLCNLKPRKLQGFKSEGMVMCAVGAKDGKEVVELLSPTSETAPVGSAATWSGLTRDEGEWSPVTPAQVDKKKVLDAALPDLQTGPDCICRWRGHTLVAGGSTCGAATVADGLVR